MFPRGATLYLNVSPARLLYISGRRVLFPRVHCFISGSLWWAVSYISSARHSFGLFLVIVEYYLVLLWPPMFSPVFGICSSSFVSSTSIVIHGIKKKCSKDNLFGRFFRQPLNWSFFYPPGVVLQLVMVLRTGFDRTIPEGERKCRQGKGIVYGWCFCWKC